MTGKKLYTSAYIHTYNCFLFVFDYVCFDLHDFFICFDNCTCYFGYNKKPQGGQFR